MLLPPSSFDQVTQIGMFINQRIAQDPDTGARLVGSNGRRRTGRNRRYWVIIPTCNLRQYETGGHAYPQDVSFGLTAESDQHAIEKANRRLPKELAKIGTSGGGR